jgi:chromosome segregation ATPase
MIAAVIPALFVAAIYPALKDMSDAAAARVAALNDELNDMAADVRYLKRKVGLLPTSKTTIREKMKRLADELDELVDDVRNVEG